MSENISGISYLDCIELMPISSNINMRSKREILDKLLIDYSVASIATYAFCGQYDLIKVFIDTLDNKFNISSIIPSKEKELIINIYNKRLDTFNLEEITYRFESSYFCMWVLGLVNNITYNSKCSVKVINDLLIENKTYNDLLDKCNLRSIKEILDYYSIISKVTYSYIKTNKTRDNIINAQDNAVRYIILYNFNKNGLKARYKKDDLKFEFSLPSNLKFVYTNNNVLFALKGSNGIKVLGQRIPDSKIQDNLKNLMKNGFEVLDVSYVRSLYIEKRIVKVNLKRENIFVTSYYIYLDNIIIRLDFSTNKFNIDSEIVYSLKIFE